MTQSSSSCFCSHVTFIIPSQTRKRQEGGNLRQSVVVGGTADCGPNDNPCNGPLKPGSDYAVRYRLFSGDNEQDYDFSTATFSTGKDRRQESGWGELRVKIISFHFETKIIAKYNTAPMLKAYLNKATLGPSVISR